MNVTYKDNSRRRTVQLLALAWGLYAISFFLPAVGDGGDKAPGWVAFLLCFEGLFGSGDGFAWQITLAFYEICNLGTLLSPVIFWMGGRRWNLSLSLVLGTALALGTVSFVYAISTDHFHLYAGYYTWLGSMTLLTTVLFRQSRLGNKTPGRNQ